MMPSIYQYSHRRLMQPIVAKGWLAVNPIFHSVFALSTMTWLKFGFCENLRLNSKALGTVSYAKEPVSRIVSFLITPSSRGESGRELVGLSTYNKKSPPSTNLCINTSQALRFVRWKRILERSAAWLCWVQDSCRRGNFRLWKFWRNLPEGLWAVTALIRVAPCSMFE
jgi:hypothetical protein